MLSINMYFAISVSFVAFKKMSYEEYKILSKLIKIRNDCNCTWA